MTTNFPNGTSSTHPSDCSDSSVPSVITVVYHPKADLASTVVERCRLAPGGKVSVSYLERVLN
jgi:hypothetical protein